jgi:chromosome segregation ATPase
MPDAPKFRRTPPGATQKLLGKALHVDIQQLASTIDDLAQQIEEGRKVLSEMFQTLRADLNGASTKLDETASALSAKLDDTASALKADLNDLAAKLDDNASKADFTGLSAQLQGKASKADVDTIGKKLKVDIDTINKKLDIIIENKNGNTPQPS